jgi:hypothetical protein
MRLFGYARVSTNKQIAAMKNAEIQDNRIFTDVFGDNYFG